MTILVIFTVLLIAVVIAFEIFTASESSDKKEKPVFDYGRKDFLMSRAEHIFFDILVEVLGGQYHVFPQIHLDEIIYPKSYSGKRIFSFRHINQKSVDFVVCDKAYIKPLLAIELDDRTHEIENRKRRDEEVERILNGAGLPLLRVINNSNFNKEEIKRLVLEKLK